MITPGGIRRHVPIGDCLLRCTLGLSHISACQTTLRGECFWVSAARVILFRYTNQVLMIDKEYTDISSRGLPDQPGFREGLGC
jgi:hypothetical protein